MNNTADPKLVTALKIYEARQAKAHKMADLVIDLIDHSTPSGLADSTVASLLVLDGIGWLKLAQESDAAGTSGVDTPSLETRAMVIAEVRRYL